VNRFLLFIALITFPKFIFAQIDTQFAISSKDSVVTDTTFSVYKNLVAKKYYGVGYTASTDYGGGGKYFIDGKRVSRRFYIKRKALAENLGKCQPCILLSVNRQHKVD
jgi:hypothetical protein